jgi:hypothetical protein
MFDRLPCIKPDPTILGVLVQNVLGFEDAEPATTRYRYRYLHMRVTRPRIVPEGFRISCDSGLRSSNSISAEFSGFTVDRQQPPISVPRHTMATKITFNRSQTRTRSDNSKSMATLEPELTSPLKNTSIWLCGVACRTSLTKKQLRQPRQKDRLIFLLCRNTFLL